MEQDGPAVVSFRIVLLVLPKSCKRFSDGLISKPKHVDHKIPCGEASVQGMELQCQYLQSELDRSKVLWCEVRMFYDVLVFFGQAVEGRCSGESCTLLCPGINPP